MTSQIFRNQRSCLELGSFSSSALSLILDNFFKCTEQVLTFEFFNFAGQLFFRRQTSIQSALHRFEKNYFIFFNRFHAHILFSLFATG